MCCSRYHAEALEVNEMSCSVLFLCHAALESCMSRSEVIAAAISAAMMFVLERHCKKKCTLKRESITIVYSLSLKEK
jgi:hypothetical protein